MPKDTISTLINNLKDKKSLEIREVLHKISHVNTNLFIFGETGVGKDFWVNYLFQIANYNRILNLNCGDVPEHLLESEWFGYKKGAFTGANTDYEGKWKMAENGILFLNQIDLLSLNLQSKLLRIIERKKYFPLGSVKEEDVRARFIFSTDYDIEQKVREGRFREDLYYRMSSYKIYIPPLRERKKDILPLFMFFARKKGLRVNLSSKAEKTLINYHWKGNIREIENFITNISILKNNVSDEDIYDLLKSPDDFLEVIQHRELSLHQLEKEYINYLMYKYKSKVKVAAILKIARKSLYNKLEKYENELENEED
jgi:transcriptional regulator with PAS, ATPase and Fis domain